jgi:hypothetical protein
MNKQTNIAVLSLSLAVLGGLVTGIVSLIVAIFSFFNSDWNSTGICLGAAALAFGLVANALLRQ